MLSSRLKPKQISKIFSITSLRTARGLPENSCANSGRRRYELEQRRVPYPRRPAYGKGIRVAFLSAYVILFHILTDTVEVLHIVHGARDLNRLFAGD